MPQVLGLLAHHADLGAAWLAFSNLLASDQSTLEPRIRELAILRVAWRTGSEYEWYQHTRMGVSAGLTTEELFAVPDGPASSRWSPLDRSVLEAVDQVLDSHRIATATWADLGAHFDTAQLLELGFVIGSYLCFATIANTIELEPDPAAEFVDAPRLPAHEGRQPE